jgi:hypothetical protein
VTTIGEGSGSITATYGPPHQGVQLTIPVKLPAPVLAVSQNPLNFGDHHISGMDPAERRAERCVTSAGWPGRR